MADSSPYSSQSEAFSEEGPLFLDAGELSGRLVDAIEEDRIEGGFACGEDLPLSPADAKVIVDKAHKSPFGKGAQTLIDDTVRKSWELNPNEFTISNSAWAATINNLLVEVHSQMALTCDVGNLRAELYKLLLYEEGAFFKPHQDTEKTPGMFGTMIISLPSPHEGGELVLRHQAERYHHSTEANYCGYSWAAWYSDVFHQVLPVTAGYRMVLTYNLAMSSSTPLARFAPTTLTRSEAELRALIREWNTNLIDSSRPTNAAKFPTYLAYRLEHQYNEASLCLDRLVGADRERAERLQRAACSIGASIYLCTLETKVVREDDEPYDHYNDFEEEDGECDDEDCEHDNSDCKIYVCRARSDDRYVRDHDEIYREKDIKNIIGLDGVRVLEEAEYIDANIIGEEEREYDEDEADDEDHSGFTGNEGCTATFWYRDIALLIVPPNKKFEFLFEGSLKWRNAQRWLQELRAEPAEDNATSSRLSELCSFLLRAPPQPKATFSWLSNRHDSSESEARLACIQDIARIALKLGKLELFDAAWIQLDPNLPIDCFDQLGRGIGSNGLETIKASIHRAIVKRKGITRRYEAFKHVRSGFAAVSNALSDTSSAASRQWIDVVLINSVVSDIDHFRQQDGETLAEIWRWANDKTISRTSLETTVFAAPTTVQAGFCLDMAKHLSAGEPHIMPSALMRLWTTFLLDTQVVAKSLETVNSVSINAATITHTDIVELLRLADHYGVAAEGNLEGSSTQDTVVERLLAQVDKGDQWDLKYTLLPLVGLLAAQAIPRLSLPPNHPDYPKAITTLGHAYLFATFDGDTYESDVPKELWTSKAGQQLRDAVALRQTCRQVRNEFGPYFGRPSFLRTHCLPMLGWTIAHFADTLTSKIERIEVLPRLNHAMGDDMRRRWLGFILKHCPNLKFFSMSFIFPFGRVTVADLRLMKFIIDTGGFTHFVRISDGLRDEIVFAKPEKGIHQQQQDLQLHGETRELSEEESGTPILKELGKITVVDRPAAEIDVWLRDVEEEERLRWQQASGLAGRRK